MLNSRNPGAGIGGGGSPAGWKPPSPKNLNLKWSLEIVRYRFYERLYSAFGWLRLPVNHRRYFSKGLLKRSVIKRLEEPIRFKKERRNPFKGLPVSTLSGWVVLAPGVVLGCERPRSWIDLIPVGFSPEISKAEGDAGAPSEKEPSGGVKEILETLRGDEKTLRKLQRVEERLKKLPYCGQSGHLALRRSKDFEITGEVGFKKSLAVDIKLEYVPHRCNSSVCPICGYYDSKEKYGKIIELLEASSVLNLRLAFATFTAKPFPDPLSAVEWLIKIRSKAYNQSISRKFLKEFRKFLLREFWEFGRNLRREKPDLWRKRIREEKVRIKEHFGSIKTRIEELKEEETRKGRVRIGDLYPGIHKLEVHKTEEGWHPHDHSIFLDYIPKVVLTAFWKYITGGRGEITDIRRFKGKKAVAEISKYITKPVNSKLTDFTRLEEGIVQSNGVRVSYEELLLLEYALYGRKKLVVWGAWRELEKRLREEEKINKPEREEEVFHLYKVFIDTKGSMWHLPRALRLARRLGKPVLVRGASIDLSPFMDTTSGDLVGYNLEELGELSAVLSAVPCRLYAVPEGYIKVEVSLQGRELRAFKDLLWVAFKRHRGWERFLKPPEEEIDTSLYEVDEGLPKHLEEQIDFDIDLL